MKKMYIAPAVELNETIASQMMALSLLDEPANDTPILGGEESDLNLWDED